MPVIRKVQKPVPGLAKFLGAESQGVLNMESDNLVRPVIEVEDYLSPNPFTIVQAVKTAVGQDLRIEVPDKKFYRWKWALLTVDDTAGGGITTTVGLYLEKNVGGVAYKGGIGAEIASNPNLLHGRGFDLKGLNGHPGDVLVARVDSILIAGNRTITLIAQYQELDL